MITEQQCIKLINDYISDITHKEGTKCNGIYRYATVVFRYDNTYHVVLSFPSWEVNIESIIKFRNVSPNGDSWQNIYRVPLMLWNNKWEIMDDELIEVWR